MTPYYRARGHCWATLLQPAATAACVYVSASRSTSRAAERAARSAARIHAPERCRKKRAPRRTRGLESTTTDKTYARTHTHARAHADGPQDGDRRVAARVAIAAMIAGRRRRYEAAIVGIGRSSARLAGRDSRSETYLHFNIAHYTHAILDTTARR